jgi:hypothetical protein
MKTPGFPEPERVRALMTGIGQTVKAAEFNGMMRDEKIVRDIEERQLDTTNLPPPLKQRYDEFKRLTSQAMLVPSMTTKWSKRR